MLASSHSFGGFGGAPTGRQAFQAAQQRQRQFWLDHRQTGGLGAAFSTFQDFVTGGQSATYQDPQGLVFCNKDSGNREQCVLNKFSGSKAKSGPIADMQKAADRLMVLIPGFNLEGQQIVAQVPVGNGSTTETKVITLTSDGFTAANPPIASRSGYDGIVGPSTLDVVGIALQIASALAQVPDNVVLAYVNPLGSDQYAINAAGIAQYLNSVVDNFAILLQAFKDRGDKPAETVLDIATIPQLQQQPLVHHTNVGVIVGSVAMVGLTMLGTVAAAKHKPTMMYNDLKPALARRRRRRR